MKKLVVVLFFLLIYTALSFGQQNVSALQKFALVIGNGNYTSFGSLPNAVNDANDITAALQSLGFTVDKVLDASRAQMVESINRLKNRLSVSTGSYGFLFYAGHGLQYNGTNYLIPAKADIPNANYLGDTAVSVQTVLAELNDAGNALNIVVLDACRDFPAAWSRSMNRGLTVVTNQPADSIIVYATSAGSTASDGTGRNGLFTSQLLKHLKTPGLEVSEVFRLTGADVTETSGKKQIPAVYNQFFGKAYLGSQPAAAAIPAPTPAQTTKPAPVAQPAPVQTTKPASVPAAQPQPAPVQTARFAPVVQPVVVPMPAPVALPSPNKIFQIGDIGPAGGTIFYDKGNNSNGWRYLEASPSDLGKAQWGLNDVDVSGIKNGIGEGKRNTELIIDELNKKGETRKAAQLCRAYALNGYNDWFLPSKDELNELYKQRSHFGITLGGLWSSSQCDNDNNAWYQGFSTGKQYNYSKNDTCSVRAVRAF